MLEVKINASLQVGRDALYSVPRELISLLRSIRQHGALLHASRDLGISYRNAWGLLECWEAITGQKLAIITPGRGTGLTAFGARFAGVDNLHEPRVLQSLKGLSGELARYLAVPAAAGNQRVVVHASHDVALLNLKERLDRHLAIDLRSEGSLNSLDAIARGNCNIAAIHMLHPPTLLGLLLTEFRSRLNAPEHYIVWLLSRHQGLMVAKRGARRIRKLQDLTRLGLKFVNRERGSGTRLLFDALLAREGIPPAGINGYEHEEYTHMAIATTIRTGMADAAFGIEAAARTHGLGFVQLVTERYYLVCSRSSSARIAVDTMLATAQSSAYARAVAHWRHATAGRGAGRGSPGSTGRSSGTSRRARSTHPTKAPRRNRTRRTRHPRSGGLRRKHPEQ